MDKEFSEAEIAKNANEFFTLLTEAFPSLKSLELGQITAPQLRSNSLMASALFLRVLAGVYYELLKDHGWTKPMIQEFFAKLAPHATAPVHENSIWRSEHTPAESFNDGAYSPNGRRQDTKALVNAITYWGVDRDKFLDEPPKPAPEPPEDPDANVVDEKEFSRILKEGKRTGVA